MEKDLNRRKFIKTTLAGGLAAGLSTQVQGFSILPSWPVKDKIRIAVMGVNSRGTAHVKGFLSQSNAEIAYICDVDERAVASGIDVALKAGQKTNPKAFPISAKHWKILLWMRCRLPRRTTGMRPPRSWV